MVNLEILNDAELLNNIDIRYSNDLIYTFVGPTLLAVNPFKIIKGQQTNEFKMNYINKIVLKTDKNSNFSYKNISPHAYSIAAEAFK